MDQYINKCKDLVDLFLVIGETLIDREQVLHVIGELFMYLNVTTDHCIVFYKIATLDLTSYTDTNWATCPND